MSNPRCVITGSSVAAGYWAEEGKGWSQLLAKGLETRGWAVDNVCCPGAKTRDIIASFASSVASKQPQLVIIGLSLANEGLVSKGSIAVSSFLTGMKTLIAMAHQIGAHVVLGSVYPNNNYDEYHYKLLLETFTEMETWHEKLGVFVLDFLGPTDDGNGHWKEGLHADASHPNTDGHAVMFSNINIELFTQYKPGNGDTKAKL